MRHYETVYIVNPNLTDEEYQSVLEKFSDLVVKNQGEMIKVNEWGKKTLAYEVKKFDKGFYVLLEHCSEPEFLKEIQRSLKLDDRILKYQTVKLSDRADPEALKAKAQEPPQAVPEEHVAVEATPSQEDSEKGVEQEGENGIRSTEKKDLPQKESL